MAQVTDNGKRRTVGSKVVSGFMPENPWESAPFIRGNPRLEKGGEKTMQKRLVNFRQRRISLGLRLVCLVVGLGLIGSLVGYGYAADTADVTLTVTPIVVAALTISPTTYAYGNLDLAISSVSASGLTITNSGSVGIKLEKTVTDDGAWILADATGQIDRFVLWSMTNPGRPASGDFTSLNTHNFSTTLTEYNNLTDSAGTQQTLSPTNTANLWFRLDMPTSVSSGAGQTITVRVRATAQ